MRTSPNAASMNTETKGKKRKREKEKGGKKNPTYF